MTIFILATENGTMFNAMEYVHDVHDARDLMRIQIASTATMLVGIIQVVRSN